MSSLLLKYFEKTRANDSHNNGFYCRLQYYRDSYFSQHEFKNTNFSIISEF
jgi:hypothetical protein